MRIGIFGGSFNPPHVGHINVVKTALEKAGIEKVLVIPTWGNPLKAWPDDPGAIHRLEMSRIAFADFGKNAEVMDIEIKKKKVNYSIDTITELEMLFPNAKLSLIIGYDLLLELPKWKDFAKILTKVDLVVTSRSGFDLSAEIDDLPAELKSMVSEAEFNFIHLKTGKEIQFLQLKDIEVSATRIRKKLQIGKATQADLSLGVESYIKEKGIFAPLTDKVSDFGKFTEFCADVLFSRKGIQVLGYDLRDISAPSEYALIGAGTSTRHTTSMAENLIREVKEEFNISPLSVEGTGEGRWVLVDYGNLIVHLFYDFVRREYSLESLWRNGKVMPLKDKALPPKQ